MGQGLQVFNESGAAIFDTSDYTCRALGSLQIGTGTGQFTDPRLAGGTPWLHISMEGNSPRPSGIGTGYVDINLWLSAPEVYVSGTTIHWRRAGALPSGWMLPAATLHYGVR